MTGSFKKGANFKNVPDRRRPKRQMTLTDVARASFSPLGDAPKPPKPVKRTYAELLLENEQLRADNRDLRSHQLKHAEELTTVANVALSGPIALKLARELSDIMNTLKRLLAGGGRYE